MIIEPPVLFSPQCDVAVVGAGAVGLVLAIGLAQAGAAVTLVGDPGPARPGRTVALLEGSVRLLEHLGVWPMLAPSAARLAHMRIVDATGSLFRTPPVQFDASEIGVDTFGFNIPNSRLEAGLREAAERCPGLRIVSGQASGFRFGEDEASVAVGDGDTVSTALVVAADGRHSLARKMARIGVRVRTWPQTALTAVLRHEAPHRDTSTEFHTREGPFTLVPLPDTADGQHRSSLVWVMTPTEAERRQASPGRFAERVETQAERLLGRMVLDSEIGRFPIVTSTATRLTGQRLVLTGEAAHALPPIGAQGLNLSFRDASNLIEVLAASKRQGQDPGSAATLARYAASRRGDVAIRTMAVDALNGSLLADSPLVDLARGVGLGALSALGPLRRLAMRHGLVPQGKVARPSTQARRTDLAAPR